MPGASVGPPETAAQPLVWSKLQAPLSRPRVSRPALLGLCMGAQRKLTLIRAPAGWGKTTLLADWYASATETRSFAWLALDRGDNDPVRFWTYVIEAVRTQQPAIGSDALPMLRVPRVDIVAEVLPTLCAELTALSSQIVLVLDDYHLITNPEIDECLIFFVDHFPQTLELVLASRSEPPLPLARMRAGGDLVEIDAQKLSFTEQEADLLLNDLNGLGLDHEAVLRLRDRTEGWAAGLYLAALTLRGRPDAAAFIQDFAGNDRHVVDYLSAEVLVGQPEATRNFLLQTSILDRFCASLCDAVTQRPDSRRILRELEASNFFLVPLDTKREWYRYHHLFGELLRQELRLTESESISGLHRRACAWHREFGSASDAIYHATAAGEIADASELIFNHWLETRDSAELETILAWLGRLPTNAVKGDARLCLVKATTLQEVGRIDEANYWLEAALRSDSFVASDASTASGLAACRAINQYFRGDAAGIRETAGPALDHDFGGTDYWRSALLTTLGTALFVGGRGDEAALVLERAVDSGEQSGHALALIHALGWCAVVYVERGDSDRAHSVTRRIHSLFSQHPGMRAYYGAAMAHIAQGALRSQHGALTEAEEELVRGIEHARRGDAKFELVYGLTAYARLKSAQGDRRRCEELLQDARAALQACVDAGVLTQLVADAEREVRIKTRPTSPRAYADELSDRELAVLRLLRTDLTQREIGEHLYLSFNTVKTHTKSIFRKLDVSTRNDAVVRARDLGLL
jgi:LuxR family transcriptional regulator, maltose regulon positive regulatory protein